MVPVKRVIREVLKKGAASSFRSLREEVQLADRSITDRTFKKVLAVMTKVERSVIEAPAEKGSGLTYRLAYEDPASD
jgi:hypothetical protein